MDKPPKFIVPQFGRLMSKIKVLAGLVSSESPFLGFLLCSYMTFPLCTHPWCLLLLL